LQYLIGMLPNQSQLGKNKICSSLKSKVYRNMYPALFLKNEEHRGICDLLSLYKKIFLTKVYGNHILLVWKKIKTTNMKSHMNP